MMNIKVPKGTPITLFFYESKYHSIDIISEKVIIVIPDVDYDEFYRYSYSRFGNNVRPIYEGKVVAHIRWSKV